jgi:hypothetical protein
MFLSCDVGKISKEENARIDPGCDSTGRLINALGRSLRNKISAKGQSLEVIS